MDTVINHGQYNPKQQVYYPDQQIRIECNPGYELDRLSPVQTCLKNGTWSPMETPKCLSESCRTREHERESFLRRISLWRTTIDSQCLSGQCDIDVRTVRLFRTVSLPRFDLESRMCAWPMAEHPSAMH